MWSGSAHWLQALRRRRRAVVCALLPAFALSAISTPACAAMLAAAAGASAQIHEHAPHQHAAGHSAHEHAAAHADEPAAPAAPPCPHCPLESVAANAGHASCTAVDGQDDGDIAQPSSTGDRLPQLLLPSWLLPAARAAPPSFAAIAHACPPPVRASIPLNLRHCVFLI
jgi:hypothetical protein